MQKKAEMQKKKMKNKFYICMFYIEQKINKSSGTDKQRFRVRFDIFVKDFLKYSLFFLSFFKYKL